MKANGIEGNYIEYKGKPLVREGNEIYYGFMSDKFYLYMLIMPTDGSGKVEKQKMVTSLFEAFDLGTAWLERANRA